MNLVLYSLSINSKQIKFYNVTYDFFLTPKFHCIFSFTLGSLPPSREGTPVSSVSKETEDRVDEMVNKRRLSFSREEPSQSIIIPASPDTMPGEVFQLENIVEEPNLQHAEGKARLRDKEIAHPYDSIGSRMATGSEVVMETSTPGGLAAEARREMVEDCLNQSLGSSLGHPLETSITSNTSIQISDSSIRVSRHVFLC